MSDFVQRAAAGSTSRRAARSPRPSPAAPATAGPSGADEGPIARVDGRTLYRARTSDGKTVLVGSRLRKDIVEAAARLASGR